MITYKKIDQKNGLLKVKIISINDIIKKFLNFVVNFDYTDNSYLNFLRLNFNLKIFYLLDSFNN